MRFLLLNDRLEVTWSPDRVAIGLAAQQDEDAGRDGEDRQDYGEATESRDQGEQAVGDEEDGQQEHANISGYFHSGFPF